jgi:hypothetical protein
MGSAIFMDRHLLGHRTPASWLSGAQKLHIGEPVADSREGLGRRTRTVPAGEASGCPPSRWALLVSNQ